MEKSFEDQLKDIQVQVLYFRVKLEMLIEESKSKEVLKPVIDMYDEHFNIKFKNGGAESTGATS